VAADEGLPIIDDCGIIGVGVAPGRRVECVRECPAGAMGAELVR
jgi:hypothetical protein